MPTYTQLPPPAGELEPVIVTATRDGGAMVNTGAHVFQVAPLDPQENNTYIREDGASTGVELPQEVQLQLDFLDFTVALLELFAEASWVSSADRALISSLADELSTIADSIQMGQATLGGARTAVQAAMEIFWGGVGDRVGQIVFTSMAGMAGAAVTIESGPGALVGGGLAASAGYLVSNAFPAEALAALSTDLIFTGVDAVAAAEATINWSFSDIMTNVYREILDQITGSEVDDLPTSFHRIQSSTQAVESGVTIYRGSIAYDRADLSGATSSVSVDLSLTGNQVSGGAGTVRFLSIEGVNGSNFADVLYGNFANNIFRGGGGGDYINGREGSDTASYIGASSGVTVDLSLFTQNTIGAGVDTLVSIENLEGSSHADTLIGNAGANRLVGGQGNDHLYGGDGNDLLIGHGVTSGNTQSPGTTVETDYLYGGSGFDVVSFEDTSIGALQTRYATNLVVDLVAGYAVFNLSNPERGDVRAYLDSIEGVISGLGDDIIYGNDADNQFITGGGNDTVYGRGGDDYIDGEGGNDYLDGGAGIDTLSYLSAGQGVTVDLGASTVSSVLGNDTIVGFENLMGSVHNDTLLGNVGDNVIHGGAGNDTLSGGGGNDRLSGGAGQDILTGGVGNNTFEYLTAADSGISTADFITDLAYGDIIDLSAVDANSLADGDQAFLEVGAFTGSAGQMIRVFDAQDNRTNFNFDLDGDGVADMLISVHGNHLDFAGFYW